MSFRVRVDGKIVGLRLGGKEDGEAGNVLVASPIEEDVDEKKEERDLALLDRIKELETQLVEAGEVYYKAGYEEGVKVGRYEVRKEMESLREQLRRNIFSLKEQFDRVIESLEEPLTTFAIRVAEKVIHKEVGERSEEIVKEKLKILLKKLTDQAKIVIRLNPDVVESFGGAESLSSSPGQKVSVIEDETLAPGDCIVETDSYIIEGTIKREIENIESELFKGRK